MAIIIAVIILKIHIPLYISRVNGSLENILYFTITLDVAIVLTIVHLIRTYDVELRLELATGVVREVVAHTARKLLIVVARVAFLVHHVGDNLLVVVARKTLVVKLHQDNQSLELAVVGGAVSLCTTDGQFFLLALLYHLVHGSSLL